MTPIELDVLARVQAETQQSADDAAWLRIGVLACAVRTSVWGTDPITPYSIIGRDDPRPAVEDDPYQDALWARALEMCTPRERH